MEWLGTLGTVLGLAIILAPLVMLWLTFFVLVPLALLGEPPAMLTHAAFTCPVRQRPVKASFLTQPGAHHPRDVTACSEFGPGPVTCAKACLNLVDARPGPTFMLPRYALLAGDEALREALPRSTLPPLHDPAVTARAA